MAGLYTLKELSNHLLSLPLSETPWPLAQMTRTCPSCSASACKSAWARRNRDLQEGLSFLAEAEGAGLV